MEYKFRGLGLCSKKWVYGNLIHMDDADEEYKDVIIPIDDNCTYVDNDDGYGAEDWHKVDSKTVGIYTGVKDINKKESYLGDIVKFQNSTGVIIFKDGCFEIDWKINRDFFNERLGLFKDIFEIVGNIYENPDMIKKEE